NRNVIPITGSLQSLFKTVTNIFPTRNTYPNTLHMTLIYRFFKGYNCPFVAHIYTNGFQSQGMTMVTQSRSIPFVKTTDDHPPSGYEMLFISFRSEEHT